MLMIKRDYNSARYNLTHAIRYIEVLIEDSVKKGRPAAQISEYEYWVSSLDLIRGCIFGLEDDQKYEGQIDIKYAVTEIRKEMTNFLFVVDNLRPADIKYLDDAWKHLKQTEAVLND